VAERQGTDTGGQQDFNDRLDRIGRALVDASAMTEREVDAAAFRVLYDRVWANIVAERGRRAAAAAWLDLIWVGRRALPALLMVAIALAAWWWLGSTRPSRSVADAQDAQWQRVALGGATMASVDDVLTFVVNWPLPERTAQGLQR
jgi:hypothetical protein